MMCILYYKYVLAICTNIENLGSEKKEKLMLLFSKYAINDDQKWQHHVTESHKVLLNFLFTKESWKSLFPQCLQAWPQSEMFTEQQSSIS